MTTRFPRAAAQFAGPPRLVPDEIGFGAATLPCVAIASLLRLAQDRFQPTPSTLSPIPGRSYRYQGVRPPPANKARWAESLPLQNLTPNLASARNF